MQCSAVKGCEVDSVQYSAVQCSEVQCSAVQFTLFHISSLGDGSQGGEVSEEAEPSERSEAERGITEHNKLALTLTLVLI